MGTSRTQGQEREAEGSVTVQGQCHCALCVTGPRWSHQATRVGSPELPSPPKHPLHVQWTCSLCVVDLSEFCRDSWSTVQVISTSLSSLVTRNSTLLVTVKVLPLGSSTTSVPESVGTGDSQSSGTREPSRGTR